MDELGTATLTVAIQVPTGYQSRGHIVKTVQFSNSVVTISEAKQMAKEFRRVNPNLQIRGRWTHSEEI